VKSSLAREEGIDVVASGVANRHASAKFSIDEFLRVHSDGIAVALTILAAIRILVFAAAFPLSNNTDEKFHFLSIQMYAQGHLPGRDLPRMDAGFARNFLLYWSPEYGLTQEELNRNGLRTPPYWLAAPARDSVMNRPYYAEKLRTWLDRRNYEAQAPPFYYIAAAAWYDLGAALGIQGWALAYWVRFLNPVIYGLFAWLSYKFTQKVYPDRTFVCLAVPALIAVFPQDVFFGMNRDVLSPLMCAAALLLMMHAVAGEIVHERLLLLASFVVGLAFLTEVSNCVLFAVLAGAFWIWGRRSVATPVRKLGFFGISAVLTFTLPLLWMWRNYKVMGDLTGGSAKMRDFGWTVRPLAEVAHHPLFTWHGLSHFLGELIANFWFGEYVWHNLPMWSAGAERFYIISSVLTVFVFAADFVRRRKALPRVQLWAGSAAMFLVGSSVLFLAAISLPFDFHGFQYPSRSYPYFVSGRIVSGALLPFLLIYTGGLELVAERFRRLIPPWSALVTVLLFITFSELLVRRVVFSSPYNFFALLRGHG